MRDNIYIRIIGIILLLTGMIIFFLGQQFFYNFYLEKPFEFYKELIYLACYFYTWGLFFLVIIKLAAKCRLEKNKWLRNGSIHFAASIIIAVLHKAISTVSFLYFVYPEKLAEVSIYGLSGKIIGGSFDNVIIYWLILGAWYSLIYYREYRETEVKSAQLQAQLATAQLQALRMQLQPHFLFNTLHAISTLMEENIGAARNMLARLSELLRQTLDNIGVQKVKLSREIEFLKSYLEIEQIRFGSRLKIILEIDDDTLDAMVPNLLLQPVVENSIRHGIAKLAKGGEIIISSKVENNLLSIKITNEIKPPSDFTISEGVGISNTRLRLQQLYGSGFRYESDYSGENKFVSAIIIPYHIAGEEQDDRTDKSTDS